MQLLITLVVVIVVLLLLALALTLKIVKQYEQGVLFRLGRLSGTRAPGLRAIIPLVDVLHRVSLRIVTMPIQSQGIITRDNVSVDVSAVAYFRVVNAEKSVIAIENVSTAINQIAQTTLRKVVGQHTLDETLSETDRINLGIREILDVATAEWGVEVTLVELKDIQLPDSMKRAMARQAEAEREKRAKIINAEGESLAAAALGDASDTMMAHPPGAPTPQPAEPRGDRRRQEHHRRVPRTPDEHDRRAGGLPRPGSGGRGTAADPAPGRAGRTGQERPRPRDRPRPRIEQQTRPGPPPGLTPSAPPSLAPAPGRTDHRTHAPAKERTMTASSLPLLPVPVLPTGPATHPPAPGRRRGPALPGRGEARHARPPRTPGIGFPAGTGGGLDAPPPVVPAPGTPAPDTGGQRPPPHRRRLVAPLGRPDR
ncbi:slipin family protein [Streptomyces xanthochromogenes]|uniref:slipin family protein n=1 Tax=Streptomyces xanthochromogenes TaxID=67384 RepID=UPI002F40DE33